MIFMYQIRFLKNYPMKPWKVEVKKEIKNHSSYARINDNNYFAEQATKEMDRL